MFGLGPFGSRPFGGEPRGWRTAWPSPAPYDLDTAVLDEDNPLTADLVHFVPLGIATAAGVRDIVDDSVSSAISTPVDIDDTAGGPGWRATNPNGIAPTNGVTDLTDEFTLLIIAKAQILSSPTSLANFGHLYSMHPAWFIGNQDLSFQPRRVEIQTTNGTYLAAFSADDFVNPDALHMYVAVYDGATLKAYKNGILNNSVSATGDLVGQDASHLRIGSYWDEDDGSLVAGSDMVVTQLWRRALSAADIIELYENPWQLGKAPGSGTTVTSDLSLQWSVVEAVQYDLALQWSVLSGVGQSVDLLWSIRQGINRDVVLSWSILEQVGRSLELQWSARSSVAQDVALQWSLKSQVASDLLLRWSIDGVLSSVFRDVDLQWSVLQPIAKDLGLQWSVRQAIHHDLALRWSLLAQVSQDVVLRWSSLQGVQDDLELRWTLLQGVAQPLVLSWGVIQGIGLNLVLRWNIDSENAFPDLDAADLRIVSGGPWYYIAEGTPGHRFGSATPNYHFQ